MVRRLTLAFLALLAAATLAVPASASTPRTMDSSSNRARLQRVLTDWAARQAAGQGRIIITRRDPQTGETLAADFEYACNPSATAWTTKAAWASGTVLEDRMCDREDDLGDVRTYLYARTRRGGTAIQSDWDFDDDGTEPVAMWVHSYTTGKEYGWKDYASNPSFNDIFGTSFVQVANIPDCSTVAGNDTYNGFIVNYQANPYGADAKSGTKDENSAQQINSFLDCGHQS